MAAGEAPKLGTRGRFMATTDSDSGRGGDASSAGATYLLVSLPLFLLGGLLLANLNEDATLFGSAAALSLACGAYLLLVGAIARGMQVAHRDRTPEHDRA